MECSFFFSRNAAAQGNRNNFAKAGRGHPVLRAFYGADGDAISDRARYEALGNAVALPCADYIMAGIREALADR